VPKNYPAFVDLVDQMMLAQKRYFRWRQPDALEHAKDLERQVRDKIKELKAPEPTPTLFD
jgi:hypothetical protein